MSHSARRNRDVKPRLQNASSQPFDLNREILASDLGKSAKLLLLAIADHAGHGRSSCTASSGQLARDSGLSRRHVHRLLPALESAGWIQIERATGSRQSKHTVFLVPREGWSPFVKLHEVGQIPVHEGMIEVGQNGPCSETKSSSHSILNGSENDKDARFAPIQQNNNPPVVHPPVADPAAQAATLALGFHRWHEVVDAP